MYDMERDYRDDRDYRDYRDYRRNYRDYRDYDRRGGRRNYRNYREEDYYEELEECMDDMREDYRKLEDVAEMATIPQEKNTLMKVAEKGKEHYRMIKDIIDKH